LAISLAALALVYSGVVIGVVLFGSVCPLRA